MRLRNLIILTVIVPLFVVLVVFSLVAIKSLEDNVRSKLQNEVDMITHALSTTLGYAVARENDASLEEALEAAFSFHRIYGAYVFDTKGREVHGLGLGRELFSREDIQQVIEDDELHGDYRQFEGWTYYSALKPLRTPDGEISGVLQVNRLNTGIENYTGFLSIVAGLVFVFGAGGIVLSIWWGFRQHIERPLNRLLMVMQRVEEGDRGQRANIEGPAEYRRLASGLNGMLDAMAEKDHDIEDRQQREIELEKRLRKSKKLAELGVLAAGVAHEIGAPLTVINGQAQRLPRPSPTLLANGQQIIQVITNLLRNAAQADGVRLIRVRAEEQQHELRLWVEDDGPGIPTSQHQKVFDPFFTTKPVGQGSGLGLSMVHRIINDHGGTIGVFNSPLGGAGFEITLPLYDTTPA
ncbi:MAG: HAMP domain-containing protein [Halomonas sp.]|nr:HAMP domain-containing protein [Halomonas sp.]